MKKNINLPKSAFLGSRDLLIEGSGTNFIRPEINRIYECFYILLNQGIIAPGLHRFSPSLPYFHITEHGLSCLASSEILPYDIDGFIEKLECIDALDEWISFYMIEALKAYNANCFNSATIMIGLASERFIELLSSAISNLLDRQDYSMKVSSGSKSDTDLKKYFDEQIEQAFTISKSMK